MKLTLPCLPYEKTALEPYISSETLNYHYNKHHQNYLNTLNKLLEGTVFQSGSLESIIASSSGPIFNNAAQVWNHAFYWNSLTPTEKGVPTPQGLLLEKINQYFENFSNFKKMFTEAALQNFGSGWTWLVLTETGLLSILNTSNAETPLTQRGKPLIALDVWEHAYYIDYRNVRAAYIEAFWALANWRFAEKNLTGPGFQFAG